MARACPGRPTTGCKGIKQFPSMVASHLSILWRLVRQVTFPLPFGKTPPCQGQCSTTAIRLSRMWYQHHPKIQTAGRTPRFGCGIGLCPQGKKALPGLHHCSPGPPRPGTPYTEDQSKYLGGPGPVQEDLPKLLNRDVHTSVQQLGYQAAHRKGGRNTCMDQLSEDHH